MARVANDTETRSAGADGDRPVGAIVRIIAARTRSVVVSRPTKSTGTLDETTETTTDHPEDLWLVSPSKTITDEDAGERSSGDLRALGVSPLDVQKDDRITHGGVEYEVDTVVGRPSDNPADDTDYDDTEYFDITLVRRN